MTSERVFTHSGDLGDILYSLPTIRAAGGGGLILYHHPGRTAHGMTREKANRIRPLLERQDYIHWCEFQEGIYQSDLNGFRDHWKHGVLADMHLATGGHSWRERTTAWLSVPPVHAYDVIVHRSKRYGNPGFPWDDAVAEYGSRAAFMGFSGEYQEFCDRFGRIDFLEAPDFDAMAGFIAGSKLFIGNQSSPLAIAHGLKHPTVMCIAPGHNQQHCVFQRMNCIVGWDRKIEWPAL